MFRFCCKEAVLIYCTEVQNGYFKRGATAVQNMDEKSASGHLFLLPLKATQLVVMAGLGSLPSGIEADQN